MQIRGKFDTSAEGFFNICREQIIRQHSIDCHICTYVQCIYRLYCNFNFNFITDSAQNGCGIKQRLLKLLFFMNQFPVVSSIRRSSMHNFGQPAILFGWINLPVHKHGNLQVTAKKSIFLLFYI